MSSKPLLFLLHGLGLSGRLWDEVRASLDETFDCIALDLPGFGDHAALAGFTVEELCRWTLRQIRDRQPARWLIAGHSMGGKIATLVSAQVAGGTTGISRPLGLILVAASPPSPEPMDEDTRRKMLGWVDGGALSAAAAAAFIDDNTADGLPVQPLERTRRDLLRSSPDAWKAWLERGSKEDWSTVAGVLDVPCLLVAGREDGPLGEACQRRQAAAHFRVHSIAVVDGAAHLVPVEQPELLATLIRDFAAPLLSRSQPPGHFLRLLASDRVSARTRAALQARLDPPPAAGGVFSNPQRATLRALLDRLLPQTDTAIDLAAVIEAGLAAGEGDGWRPAELPADAAAWRAGLDTLASSTDPAFAALAADAQDAAITQLIAGRLPPDRHAGGLDPQQMRRWLGEVRRASLRTWLAHPAAMAAIGYDGFANGGDSLRLQGYQNVKADRPDPWQRAATVSGADEPGIDGRGTYERRTDGR